MGGAGGGAPRPQLRRDSQPGRFFAKNFKPHYSVIYMYNTYTAPLTNGGPRVWRYPGAPWPPKRMPLPPGTWRRI
jgi:hypothetical protein